MKSQPRKTIGHRDVWDDLGLKPAEAQNLRMRSAMLRALEDFIEGNNLTPARAAKLLGVTEARVADLAKGKINAFSLSDLVKLLAKAGLRVDIQVRKAA